MTLSRGWMRILIVMSAVLVAMAAIRSFEFVRNAPTESDLRRQSIHESCVAMPSDAFSRMMVVHEMSCNDARSHDYGADHMAEVEHAIKEGAGPPLYMAAISWIIALALAWIIAGFRKRT